MGAVATTAAAGPRIAHSREYRIRRFLNWFPLGLTYALLYMGRYNLTVAQTSLSDTLKLMTKEDFGVIFGVGALVYGVAFLVNGPLVDRIGGRKGMLIAAAGSTAANFALGLYLRHVLGSAAGADQPIRLVFSVLYAANMYFQSFGAVSIVKVNAHWFHVSERGGFSGIFGTMISSGIFLAFTVNGWLLGLTESIWGKDARMQHVVFFGPGALLALFFVVEAFLLRDRPSEAGHQDFDTGDASSGDTDEKPIPTMMIFRRLLTNPIIVTVALIEFCTGVLRNGVMHWFPIYAKEVWALPKEHFLVNGSWESFGVIAGMFAVALVCGLAASRVRGSARGWLIVVASLAFLGPFVQGGWGGLLMVAGVIGGNAAGWVSDLFFQSRRGPAAAFLYALLGVCTVGMIFALTSPKGEVAWADEKSGLRQGDRVLSIAGKDIEGWNDVRKAVGCWEPTCEGAGWDAAQCACSTKVSPPATRKERASGIPARIVREGREISVDLPDPKPVQRAGDKRMLKARPVLPMSPWWLGAMVLLMSVCVIGTHGVLSGTATMDFGGRKAAGTAVGLIDGLVYLGTFVQSVSLGFLTSRSWGYWAPFLVPFAFIGFLLCLRIWNAKPKGGAPAKKPEPEAAGDGAPGPARAA